jgi:hypothetical protein
MGNYRIVGLILMNLRPNFGLMGIRDRDYMKRPSDDGGEGSSPDSKAEEMAQRFLRKFPRFFMYCGIGFVVLILIFLAVLKFSGKSH